jgi:serine/threonine protein kinase
MEAKFWFDVTAAFQPHKQDYIKHAWPAPRDGPYSINEKEYREAASRLISQLDAGVLSQDEMDRDLKEILDNHYPKIAGRFQVHGFRRGSMGITYLCVDTAWSPASPGPYFVACKSIERSSEDFLIEALKREARLWLGLGAHPNLIQLLDVIAVSPSRLVLVMEAILPGPLGKTTVKEWLDADLVESPLAVRFLHGLTRAMAYCQRRLPGFVHGDLKPENLLVGTGYVLKVTDLGLARANGLGDVSLKRIVGTPLYLAPECWQGQDHSEKSDVYAAAMIAYELFTGKHPFEHEKETDGLKTLHLRQVLQPLTDPLISERIRNLLAQCLGPDPSKRPTFNDLLSGLGIEELSDVESNSSESAAEWNNKGKSLAQVGEHEQALEYYARALTLAPSNSVGWNNFAISLSMLGDNDRAERAYTICLGIGNGSAETYANYAAHILRAADAMRFEEALALCDRALKLDPKLLVGLINKAAVLNALDRFPEAAQIATQATKIDPAHPHGWVELGTAYWKMGRRSKAIKCAKKALKLDPVFGAAITLKRLLEIDS